MLPTEVVPCSDTTTLSEANLSSPSTLTVTFEEKEDVLAYFEEVSLTEENVVHMNLHSVSHKLYVVSYLYDQTNT